MSGAPIKSYSCSGRPPDFAVRYRFFTAEEGGRSVAPRQHIRWDFLYHGDDPQRDGIYMIWPEFLDLMGDPLSDGPVPYEGTAHMFILDPDMREQIHRSRISLGVRGYFVEGAKRVAECEVIEVIGLSELRRD